MQTQSIQKSWRALLAVGIAAVMVVTASVSALAMKPNKSGAPGDLNIVETAVAVNADSGEFSTLIAAVTELDLAGVLSGNRPFTVFAPTDAAFAEIGLNANSFIGLSQEEAEGLRNVVLFHVTNGVRYSQSVVGDKQLRMANGDFAMVSGTSVSGNGNTEAAGILVEEGLFDIRTSNGVIHVIDAVLLP